MRALQAILVAGLLLFAGMAGPVFADTAQVSEEAALARELAAEREKLDSLKRSLGSDSELVRNQERKVMELRARLSGLMARELTRRALDPERWRHSLEELRSYLRERMRPWLEPEREQRPLPSGVWRA